MNGRRMRAFPATPVPPGRSRMRKPALIALALAACAAPAARAGTAPPIGGLQLDWSTYTRKAQGSDNWPTTWAADGSVYTSYGDGGGFGGARQSLGFARLSGDSARTVRGVD